RQFTGPGAAVNAAALAPNGNLVVGGAADGRLFLWNAADAKVLGQKVAHLGGVTGLAFHPQNTQLLSAGKDGSIKLWPLPPIPARSLTHPAAVLAAATTADGERLFTGSDDK